MSQTIQARVFQKTATIDQWMINPLILGKGEQAFVVDSDGNVIAIKVGDGSHAFSDLSYYPPATPSDETFIMI